MGPFKSWLGGPFVELDPTLVSSVTSRHPFRLVNSEVIEESLQPRRWPFANVNNALRYWDCGCDYRVSVILLKCGGRSGSHPRATANKLASL